MAASRFKRAAGFGMAAAIGLLAAVLCTGCSFQREYVRRGQVLDSMSVRLMRVEQAQPRHDQEMAKLRADVLPSSRRSIAGSTSSMPDSRIMATDSTESAAGSAPAAAT